VLKEYCSPIPEEDEEMTPPAESNGKAAGPNATVLVLNDNDNSNSRPQTGSEEQRQQAEASTTEQDASQRALSSDETNRPVSPVSPLTT
jgi:hypothetical protein